MEIVHKENEHKLTLQVVVRSHGGLALVVVLAEIAGEASLESR